MMAMALNKGMPQAMQAVVLVFQPGSGKIFFKDHPGIVVAHGLAALGVDQIEPTPS
jgi:hypothetical protein